MHRVATPDEISKKGEKLYREKYQREYEITSPGKYLAIDITTELPYIADTPEAALETAISTNPQGFFTS